MNWQDRANWYSGRPFGRQGAVVNDAAAYEQDDFSYASSDARCDRLPARTLPTPAGLLNMRRVASQSPPARRDWRLGVIGSCCSSLGIACLLLAACSNNPVRAPIAVPAPPTNEAAPAPLVPFKPVPPITPVLPAEARLTPWDRLRRRFSMPGCNYNASVQHWARLYAESPGQFSASLSEAMPYLLLVIDQLERRDLPGEFAFLPFVESTYAPIATTGDRAAGIWQLMPDTAREAGLKITAQYDGRLDIYDSGVAAIDLLEQYQHEFGDWRLADMAYNAGEYKIKQLISRQPPRKDAEEPLSARELGLLRVNSGTHEHLAKLLALACVISEPERFRVELPDPQSEDELVLLDLPAPVDLRVAARLSGMDEAHLRHLNPGFLRARMPDDGPYHLLVPLARRVSVEQTLGKLPQYAWREWREVTLKQTETLDLFAMAADLDPSALATINGFDANAPLAPGTRLLIPGHVGHEDIVSPVETPTFPASAPERVTVHAGDTLWDIARRYGVHIDDLLHWNDLSRTATLHLGQHLRLSAPDRSRQ